ncbi:EmrB/QacA subfamily drug resistance transporter [Amycolatopsis bartoniae]|uniref:MFS transporter n=1 Tax=Amycolatopsis bartoniae TaxID=941986 RepID=A0A8H9IYB7_9PSEU|nr:MFS transporter [Amycolatopsis bartoniae]MBB2936459.1 EmrB/QacA subfamily drug resistance transporter [Amycolatopsis bartoniae]TVT11056.1 MFS transporter [Amycolatopsis bartoniae]GHF68794.1 MFS transporter [Amycolatopsis bartoniae]
MSSAAQAEQMTPRQIARAFSGLLLALLVAVLSSTIVSNALPTILADLNGSQSQYTWVVTATLLASTASTPIWGKLSDLFSKKMLYQLAIVIYTAGSVLGGISQSMPELIAFRAVQGLGLGGLQALVQVVIAAMISPRDRGRYSGYIGAVFALGTVSGPLLGGLIVDSPLGWRWCFWITVPIAVLAFIVLGKTLHLPVVKQQVKIDWLGATLLVGGVSLLLIWVSLAGGSFAWWSVSSLLYVLGGVAALALAVFVESRVSNPVVPLRLFRGRTFTLAVLGSLAVGTAMFGGAVFLGQYYQLARGYSPTHAGLMTVPMMLGLFLSSTIAGQVISRTGRTKSWMVGGAVLLVASLFLLSTVDHDTNLVLMGCYLALLGLGVGALMQNLVLVVQNTVAMKDMGSSSSVVTFFRSLGGAAGVSALGALLAAKVSDHVSSALAGLGISGGTQSSGGSLNVGALPEPIQSIVRAAYGDSIGSVFFAGAIIAVVTLLAVLFIKEVPLRRSIDLTEGAPAVAGTGISGVVSTPSGRPLAGAALTLTDATGQQVARAVSGEDGRYELTAAPNSSYVLIASAGRYQPSATGITVNGQAVRRDVKMTGAGGLGGVVRSRGGQPVGGATLVLTDFRGEVVASVVTGGDGWYHVEDLPGGTYTLTVAAPAHRPTAAAVSTVDGEEAVHDVELDSAAELAGVVRTGRGRPVPEAQVTLLDVAGEVVATTYSDEEGRYRFPDVPAGDYTLVTSGFAPVSAPLAVRPGRLVSRDVEVGHATA